MGACSASRGSVSPASLLAGGLRRRLRAPAGRDRPHARYVGDGEWNAVAQSLADLLLTLVASTGGLDPRCRHRARRRPRCCTGSVRPSSAGSTIPIWCRRGSRRPRAFPSVTCKNCSRRSATILPTTSASDGCSAPGPTCRIRPRRIARSPDIAYAYGFGDFRAFQPCLSPSLRAVAAGIPPAGSRALDRAARRRRPARLAAGGAGTVARASVWRARTGAAPLDADADLADAENGRAKAPSSSGRSRRVHWGYFSRSLTPQIEISLGRHHHHRDTDAACLRRS